MFPGAPAIQPCAVLTRPESVRRMQRRPIAIPRSVLALRLVRARGGRRVAHHRRCSLPMMIRETPRGVDGAQSPGTSEAVRNMAWHRQRTQVWCRVEKTLIGPVGGLRMPYLSTRLHGGKADGYFFLSRLADLARAGYRICRPLESILDQRNILKSPFLSPSRPPFLSQSPPASTPPGPI